MQSAALPPSRFTEQLLARNALDASRFRAWALAPGMGLGQRETWWGNLKPRPLLHEGVDLCCYFSPGGDLHLLPERLQVPAIYGGTVVKLLPDYLGTSVFLEHRMAEGVILTIFGHTLPRQGLALGQTLKAGEVFCAMAPRRASRTSPHAHLHLSLAWSPDPVAYEGLDWSNMGDGQRVRLLDPLPFLGAPWEETSLAALSSV
ncbi:MAG: Peptidase [Holophagaceae bacterium]|nr:Peptidase [Holophagaceae bacterium]